MLRGPRVRFTRDGSGDGHVNACWVKRVRQVRSCSRGLHHVLRPPIQVNGRNGVRNGCRQQGTQRRWTLMRKDGHA